MFQSLMSKCCTKSKLVDRSHLWTVTFHDTRNATDDMTKVICAPSAYKAMEVLIHTHFSIVPPACFTYILLTKEKEEDYMTALRRNNTFKIYYIQGKIEEAYQTFMSHYCKAEPLELYTEEDMKEEEQEETSNNKRSISPSHSTASPPPPKVQKLSEAFVVPEVATVPPSTAPTQ